MKDWKQQQDEKNFTPFEVGNKVRVIGSHEVWMITDIRYNTVFGRCPDGIIELEAHFEDLELAE